MSNVTEEEKREIRVLAESKEHGTRVPKRAAIILSVLENPGLSPAEAGRAVGYRNGEAGRRWVDRFNEAGIEGLFDKPRPGRPPTHETRTRKALFKLAQTDPRTLGLSFDTWTLERLQKAFEAREGVHLAMSTIWSYVEAEGLKWRQRKRARRQKNSGSSTSEQQEPQAAHSRAYAA